MLPYDFTFERQGVTKKINITNFLFCLDIVI